jgi:glycosyltransferase involved in cell wall biosynthesis
MPRILFIAAHRPDRSPSQRYRFEQFMPCWEDAGFHCDMAWIIDEDDDPRFYRPGGLVAKSRIFLKGRKRRGEHVRRAKDYDLLFLQREAFMTHSTRFERELAGTGVPMIYDFDDAIWLLDVSQGNRKLRWLKDPGKTARIIPLATTVIAGNGFLADYARALHKRVEVIPTVIDTERYQPAVTGKDADAPVTIGWTGSHTGISHLKEAVPVLLQLQQRFGGRLRFRIISDRELHVPGLDIRNRRWTSATEPEDLADVDIGIMPLPENEWTRGKCGFKGLQFMGMATAVVLQDHGVNRNIVQHGVNGFLASGPQQWEDRLAELILDADLRQRLGQAARTTVVERYSIAAWKDRYIALFNELIEQRKP